MEIRRLIIYKEKERIRMENVYTLSNNEVTIRVNEQGAELVALSKGGVNYLWNGDEAYWGRCSPVLFPIVGRLKDNSYTHMGVTYSMTQHGFARDSRFELVSIKEDEIWHRVTANEETKKKYPFDFLLDIGYRIDGHKVIVMWKVSNVGTKNMPFSIGAHPGFFCPLHKEEEQAEYFIDLHSNDSVVYKLVNEAGYMVDKAISLPTENGILAITEELFDRDALIFEDGQLNRVSLLDKEKKPYISVSFDAPLVGIWSPPKKRAPFICIEPWYGRCDKEGFTGEFSERDGIEILEPNEVFEASYIIEVM